MEMSKSKLLELEHIIEWKEGWEVIQEGINKLKRIMDGQQESFSSEEYMTLYTIIYKMCSQFPPQCYSRQLYNKFKEALDEYINSTVLPALREKHDAEFILREFVKRWENHKRMVARLSHIFHPLQEKFISLNVVPSLNDVGLTCFHDSVYLELSGKVINAVIALIEKEREGEQIDRALLKKVVDILVAIGKRQIDYYLNDFEDAMLRDTVAYYVNDFEDAVLRDTASYYSRKASIWIVEDSYQDYMSKAEECLKKEKDRVSHYLHVISETKLLEIVKNELLDVYTNQLIEKERSGSQALLRDDKHVTAEDVLELVQQAENNKAESSGSF